MDFTILIIFLLISYGAYLCERDQKEKSARLWEIERRLGMHEKHSENDYDKYF
jgi:hypothetical protein